MIKVIIETVLRPSGIVIVCWTDTPEINSSTISFSWRGGVTSFSGFEPLLGEFKPPEGIHPLLFHSLHLAFNVFGFIFVSGFAIWFAAS